MCPVPSGGRQWQLALEHTAEPLLCCHSFRSCACPRGSCQVMPPDFLLPSRTPSPGLAPHAQGAQGRAILRMCAYFYFKYSAPVGVITDLFTRSQGKDGMIYNRHIKNKILNLNLATVASFYLCFKERVMVSKGENEILV